MSPHNSVADGCLVGVPRHDKNAQQRPRDVSSHVYANWFLRNRRRGSSGGDFPFLIIAAAIRPISEARSIASSSSSSLQHRPLYEKDPANLPA